jgi:hypothetical protein
MYMRKNHKRTVQSGGEALDGKVPFPLMTKGRYLSDVEERGMVLEGEEIYQRHGPRGSIFIRCRGQRHGSRGRRFIRCRGQRHGSMGSMIDMISVLHQSVSINSKGGYFLLRLVFIDVNP